MSTRGPAALSLTLAESMTVPPLMPPIAHSSWFAKRTDASSHKSASSSSPVAATALRSSTSTTSHRSSLRFSGTAATTYEDELMQSTLAGTDKGLSSALSAPRTSGEMKHRKGASVSGSQPQFSGSQSVRASSSFFGGGATVRKAVWRPWTVGQQLLAAGDASASLLVPTPHISLADELAACEEQQPDLVSGQVSRVRQEQDRRVEQRRIDALEEEVRKLRNEVSIPCRPPTPCVSTDGYLTQTTPYGSSRCRERSTRPLPLSPKLRASRPLLLRHHRLLHHLLPSAARIRCSSPPAPSCALRPSARNAVTRR